MILPENRHPPSDQVRGRAFSGSCTAKREVSAPRLGRQYRTGRPAESPEAWPDAEPWATNVPLARAAVERREASADCKPRAVPRGAAVEEQRLSAFCVLLFRAVPIVISRLSTAGLI